MFNYGEEYFKRIHDTSGEGRGICQIRARMLFAEDPLIRKVLDVGCGFGDFLRFVEEEGVEAAGVDVSSHAVAKARKKVKGEVYKLDVASNALPFSSKSFDAVTIFDVVEHLSSSKLLFQEVFRVLSPGGLAFITTPNHQGWLREITTKIFPDDPTHVNVQNGAYWKGFLKEAGFGNINIKNCLLHGLPPLPAMRRAFRRLHLPTYLGPIFFPESALSGTLYIFASKNLAS
jgi:SAM-dependent methyltransferase